MNCWKRDSCSTKHSNFHFFSFCSQQQRWCCHFFSLDKNSTGVHQILCKDTHIQMLCACNQLTENFLHPRCGGYGETHDAVGFQYQSHTSSLNKTKFVTSLSSCVFLFLIMRTQKFFLKFTHWPVSSMNIVDTSLKNPTH